MRNKKNFDGFIRFFVLVPNFFGLVPTGSHSVPKNSKKLKTLKFACTLDLQDPVPTVPVVPVIFKWCYICVYTKK